MVHFLDLAKSMTMSESTESPSTTKLQLIALDFLWSPTLWSSFSSCDSCERRLLTCSENMFRLCNALFRINIKISVKLRVAITVTMFEWTQRRENTIYSVIDRFLSHFFGHIEFWRLHGPGLKGEMNSPKRYGSLLWCENQFEKSKMRWNQMRLIIVKN